MAYSNLALDPRVVEDPYRFSPDRWLRDDGSIQSLKRSVLPFGRGTRMCLGSE